VKTVGLLVAVGNTRTLSWKRKGGNRSQRLRRDILRVCVRMAVEITFHLYFRPILPFVSDVPASVTKSPGPFDRLTSISSEFFEKISIILGITFWCSRWKTRMALAFYVSLCLFSHSTRRCSLMFRGNKIEELCGIQWRERVFAKTGISLLYFTKLISSSQRRILDWQTAWTTVEIAVLRQVSRPKQFTNTFNTFDYYVIHNHRTWIVFAHRLRSYFLLQFYE